MPPPSPADEGSDVPTTENFVRVANEAGRSSGQEVLGGARVSASTATEARPTPTCSVCMEPWSCSGAHRICCIPCGHVYGRSCLEKWLGACRNASAKCPLCGAVFEHDHIINIHAPGDLFDGCSRMQEEEERHSKIAEFRAGFKELVLQHQSQVELETSKLEPLVQPPGDVLQPPGDFLHQAMNMLRSMIDLRSSCYLDLARLVSQYLYGPGEVNPK